MYHSFTKNVKAQLPTCIHVRIGQYLYQAIKDSADQEVAFVWNRTSLTTHETVEGHHILEDLSLFADRKPDLIVEVAHPIISSQYGEAFLAVADYMVGSPTALANQEVEDKLRKAAKHHGLYIPSGALWGSSDIQKMADRGTLQALTVTMKKHPNSFKLNSPLKDKNDAVTDCETVLYEGPVRSLCPLAPNNVNTMAAAAMAAHNLGFDKVQGRLLADPSLTDWHVVEVDVTGPGDVAAGSAFTVSTVRKNPAKVGKVTGSATYASFLSSVSRAHGRGAGVHLC
ncbi:putative L-aspartate dehydrogenase isoform X2 [Acanthaster planci]|uniref:Aspartate dehydrogenase domain-containing protein n=1 Tax=Acanthaster planci TaxID=133434 RepID=A0A8B7YSQ0_ACAPL|nr:putative L-aspartate dehydrogenase isoform X2 [Acanthaster planci]